MYKFKCCICGTDAWLPAELKMSAERDNGIHFYCGYGHGQHFKKNRKELDEEAATKPPSQVPKVTEGNVLDFPKRSGDES